MKVKFIIYIISLILTSVALTKVGVDQLLNSIHIILLVLIYILAELMELNNKNYDRER